VIKGMFLTKIKILAGVVGICVTVAGSGVIGCLILLFVTGLGLLGYGAYSLSGKFLIHRGIVGASVICEEEIEFLRG
jgi:hypothetical protein